MIGAKRRRLLWRVLLSALVTAGLVISLRYQGLVVPVRIASGSMAEGLLGPHRLVSCAECGFAIRCGADTEAPLERATCPNCGFQRNELAAALLHDGDRVLIDRWAYLWHAPQRGDVAAFVDPANASVLAVKRIMGLPRESVAIRHGELFINGSLYRKSLRETKQLATLVHDDAYRPSESRDLPPRWASDDAVTAWQTTNQGYRWAPPAATATGDDWLMYRHWRCYRSPQPRTEEAPATDNDAYNQGLSRELHEVTDLLLACQMTLAADGEITLLIHDGRENFRAVLAASPRSINLYREQTLLQRATLPTTASAVSFAVEFGVIDEQLLLAIDGKTIIRRVYEPADRPRQPTSRPLGLAGRQGECMVSSLRVYRDVFYLHPFGGDWAWDVPAPLDDDSYLMLGDNAPLSSDSRHWSAPGLPRERLIGKVLKRWRETR